MRHVWKIAALVAAWASLGVTGCARGPEETTEDEGSALMTPQVEAEQEITDEGSQSEALVSPEATDDADDALAARPIEPPIGPPIGPPLGPRFRPPICRHGARRVRVGRGYICVGGGPFAPLPFCPGSWRLTRVGRGFLCERSFFPPHGPHPRPF